MKKNNLALTILNLIVIFGLVNNKAKCQILFQDFSSSTTVSDYVNSSPNSNQFNSISTSGTGTVISINTGQLRFVRTGNAGSISRTTDFTGSPSSLVVRMQLNVPSSSGATTSAAVFQIGSGFTTSNSAESNANTHSRFAINIGSTSGQFSLRDINASVNGTTTLSTSTLITWVINNSGASITYRAPNGNQETVADDTWDLWIGTTKEFNDRGATTTSQSLADFKFAFTSGSATIDIDNISADPLSIINSFRTSSVNSTWTNSSDWEISNDGSNWTSSSVIPTVNSHSILVRNGHVLTIPGQSTSTTFFVDDISIESGGTLNVGNLNDVSDNNNNLVLYVHNGVSTNDVNIDGSLIVNENATIRTRGTINNNSVFRLVSSDKGDARIGDSKDGTFSGSITVQRYLPSRRAFRFLASPVTTSNFISNNWQQQTHITGTGGASNGFDASTLNNNSMFTLNESTQSWTAIPNTNATNLQQGVGYRILIRGDRTVDLTSNTATPTAVTLSATGTHTTGDKTYNTSSTPAISGTTNNYTFLGNPFPSSIDWNAVSRTNVSSTYYTWRAQGGTNNRGAYVNFNATGNVSSDGNINQYIGSGQGFMIQTTGASPSITIEEADKVSNAQGNQIRGKSSNPNTLRINVFEDDSIFADGFVIYQNNNAKDEYEEYDSEKWINPGLTMYSLTADNKKVSIQGFKTLTIDRVIELGIEKTEKTNYKLEFTEFDNLLLDPYLIDRFTNTETDIKRNPVYRFNVNENANSSAINRFSIVFKNSASTGVNEAINNNRFVVYPNPAVDVLNIQSISQNVSSQIDYVVYNQIGANMQSGNLQLGANNQAAININNLSNGVYFIQLLDAKGGVQTIKFIK
ncbi:MAG: T9SS type A sorting domain-containing protein [Bacteroidia bacterium]